MLCQTGTWYSVHNFLAVVWKEKLQGGSRVWYHQRVFLKRSPSRSPLSLSRFRVVESRVTPGLRRRPSWGLCTLQRVSTSSVLAVERPSSSWIRLGLVLILPELHNQKHRFPFVNQDQTEILIGEISNGIPRSNVEEENLLKWCSALGQFLLQLAVIHLNSYWKRPGENIVMVLRLPHNSLIRVD